MRKQRNKQQGVASIEFALGFMAFWLMCMFWVEMSYLSYVSAVGDLVIAESSRSSKTLERDLNTPSATPSFSEQFQQSINDNGSVWKHVIDPSKFQLSIRYVDSVADLAQVNVSCEPVASIIKECGSLEEDNHTDADGNPDPIAVDQTNRSLAVYRLSYDFSPIFTYFMDTKAIINREVIVIQEYEREDFGLAKLMNKQQGNFAVEFAVIGVFFSLILVFSADVILKISMHGKLDRLSYSLVNVLKERTQLYNGSFDIIPDKDADGNELTTSLEATQLMQIASFSLQRMSNDFKPDKLGALIEVLTFSDINRPNPPQVFTEGTGCQVSTALKDLSDLSVVTSWGRQTTLYRVTLCYDTDNMFGQLIGKNFATVSSSSLMIGR